MSNYPLRQSKVNWRILTPSHAWYTEDYLRDHYDLYLTTEFINDESGRTHRYYRLNAASPHSIEMALAYDVKCPKCSHVMKQVGRCKNYYTLGLYECPVCDRK